MTCESCWLKRDGSCRKSIDSGDVGLTVDPTAGCMETLSLIVDEPQTKKSEVSPVTRRRNEKTGPALPVVCCNLAIS